MDVKLKRKWIKALLSGEYRQARKKLYSRGCYCCLGVLACVQGASVGNRGLQIKGEKVNGGDGELLGKKFAAGLHTKTQLRLASMNDGTGRYFGKRASFAKIAAFIQKNL